VVVGPEGQNGAADVAEPPCDGGDGRGSRLRELEVDDEVALAGPSGSAPPARSRMLQHRGTGSQKYSSSVMPASRGRNDIVQYHPSCSMAIFFQSSATGAFYCSGGRVRDAQ
jgi:hypothetical protein